LANTRKASSAPRRLRELALRAIELVPYLVDDATCGRRSRLRPLQQRRILAQDRLRRRGSPRDARLGGRGRRERFVVRKDRLLEPAQLRSGFEPELGVECGARRAERGQRVGVAAGAVEREHQLAVQALVPRVLADQLLELADQLVVPAEPQIGVHPILECGKAQLVQAPDLGLREALIAHLRQRRPAPQPQRVAQDLRGARGVALLQRPSAVLRARPKHLGVQLPRPDREQVAAGRRAQPRRASNVGALERLAQPRDGQLQALDRARRGRLASQLLDQPIDRHRLVGMQQQQREQRPLLGAAKRHRQLTVLDLERTQDPELHARHVCLAPTLQHARNGCQAR
jgi:hypothetical protein